MLKWAYRVPPKKKKKKKKNSVLQKKVSDHEQNSAFLSYGIKKLPTKSKSKPKKDHAKNHFVTHNNLGLPQKKYKKCWFLFEQYCDWDILGENVFQKMVFPLRFLVKICWKPFH